MDTGSQRSYATDTVKKALNLESKEAQRLSVATFEGTTLDLQRYGVIQVGLKLKDGGNKELQLITVPSIREPLTTQPISLCLEKFEHLKKIDLSDHSNGQDHLQIGLDIQAEVKVALLLYIPDLDGYFLDPYPRRSGPRAPQAS